MSPVAKSCPTCGSRRIRRQRSDFPMRFGSRRVVVPELERQECPVCGEVLFDRDAMKKIQSHYPPARRKSA
ncbi:MAG: YgiT-type zinc finger protein [Tepidisphaeraceae bacterium]